jgi:hypothetical protein
VTIALYETRQNRALSALSGAVRTAQSHCPETVRVEMREKTGSESLIFESQQERDDRIQREEEEQEDVREDLTNVIRNENEQLQRERTRKASRVDFGPSFDLAYRSNAS